MEVESFDNWLNKGKVEEVKLSGHDADRYANKAGLKVKRKNRNSESELANGGSIDSELIDVVADLEKETGLKFTITAGNDNFHQNITAYRSNHTVGKAIDITSPDLASSHLTRRKLETAIVNLVISGKYNKDGNRLGGINEYDKATSKSTGGHFHISITPDLQKRDGVEFMFPLIGISSYAQIREKVQSGTSIDSIESPDTEVNVSNIKQPRKTKNINYYKVYDKKNRRFLTAKYKGDDLFKVYNRTGQKVGEVVKKGESIFLDDVDITSSDIGESFIKLFKLAKANKELPSDEDYITVNGSGSIKHNYSGAQANNINLIENAATKHGVTNKNSIIGILSVIGKESQFIPKSEKGYSGTDNNRIRSIFSSKLGNMSDSELNNLKSNDEAFFNAIYGGRYGNSQSEGYKYRGRGFNQITFKGTYEKYSKLLNMDLVNNPDLLNDPNVAAEAAVLFLLNRFKEKGIDPNSFNTKDEALMKFAAANAGWGKDPSNAIANAEKIAPNFSLA
jgi:predicted chitinase